MVFFRFQAGLMLLAVQMQIKASNKSDIK